VTETKYDALIDTIYDAALDPAGWSQVLGSLNGLLNSQGFALFFQDRTSIRFNRFMGLDSSQVAAYENHFGAVNPWAPAFARQPDKIAAHELIAPDALERTEFFNDWLKPLGLHDAIGIPIRAGNGALFLASGLRDKKAGYYTAAEKRLARRVTPHMRRAIEIHERLHAAQFVRDGLVQSMDRLDIGVLLLDGDCRVLFANRAAETILKRGDGLIHHRGRLLASHPGSAEELEKTVRAAAATGGRRGGDAGGTVIVRGKRGKPMTVLICPRRSEIDFGQRHSSVIAFIGNPDTKSGLDENHAARLYGLSRAEARLLKALLQGTRLSDYAGEAGITVNTAKGYLKQIFHKTGTGRQADLLRLFFSDPVLRLGSGQTRARS
jgi:DNA-binding CsgD family transcriptional regulator/PAS domain-containing protein